jgi:hypothetical protein
MVITVKFSKRAILVCRNAREIEQELMTAREIVFSVEPVNRRPYTRMHHYHVFLPKAEKLTVSQLSTATSGFQKCANCQGNSRTQIETCPRSPPTTVRHGSKHGSQIVYRVFRSALQIPPTHSLKGFKT